MDRWMIVASRVAGWLVVSVCSLLAFLCLVGFFQRPHVAWLGLVAVNLFLACIGWSFIDDADRNGD